jgi:hypothetical protein
MCPSISGKVRSARPVYVWCAVRASARADNDYSNPRVGDFNALNKPFEDMYDRGKVPRMPWCVAWPAWRRARRALMVRGRQARRVDADDRAAGQGHRAPFCTAVRPARTPAGLV